MASQRPGHPSVKKGHASGGSCTGTVTVDMLYWRSISGDTIAETDGTGSTANSNYNEYIFFAGRRIAQSNPSSGNVYYYFVDHLGSTRVVTTATGAACYEADFLPYGTENTPSGFSNTCSTRYRFTGYERDLETAAGTSAGNDYAFARYYNSRLGRFMSGDPLDGDITDPQTLNRYAYVRNNPVNFVDPSGKLLCALACLPPIDFEDPIGDCSPGPTMGCGPPYPAMPLKFPWQVAPPPPKPYDKAVSLAKTVLSGNNGCANFFNSAVLTSGDVTEGSPDAAAALASDQFITEIMTDPRTGLPTPTIGATSPQNGGFGSYITINSDPAGLFLATNHWILGGIFPSGQLAGQTTQILHELAHTLGLIRADANGGSEANTATIIAKCATAILAAINGVQ